MPAPCCPAASPIHSRNHSSVTEISVQEEAEAIVDFVGRSGGKLTAVQLQQVFMGITTKSANRVQSWRSDRIWGKGKQFKKAEVERIIKHLTLRKYLREVEVRSHGCYAHHTTPSLVVNQRAVHM